MPLGGGLSTFCMVPVMSEESGALVEIAALGLESFGNRGMEGATLLAQQGAECYFLCQGMLERVMDYWIDRVLVNKLVSAQCLKTLFEFIIRHLGHRGQKRLGEVLSDDGGGLQ